MKERVARCSHRGSPRGRAFLHLRSVSGTYDPRPESLFVPSPLSLPLRHATSLTMWPLFSCLWLLTLLPPTITVFHCSTPSDTIMSHNMSSAEQIQKRSASRFKAKLAIPWPLVTRNGRRLRVVKYCYADKYTRDLFDCPKVQDAFTLWADRLGYPAGQATGHSLSWDEADDRNPDPSKRRIEYCFQPELSGGKAVWNDKVDKDTENQRKPGSGHRFLRKCRLPCRS